VPASDGAFVGQHDTGEVRFFEEFLQCSWLTHVDLPLVLFLVGGNVAMHTMPAPYNPAGKLLRRVIKTQLSESEP
jgi:hypothetical protein